MIHVPSDASKLCRSLVALAFVSLPAVAAYAQNLVQLENPTEKAEVRGGIYATLEPDGQLKFSADTAIIPLKDGRYAVMQDGRWSFERLPRDTPTDVSLLDFAVSWKQHLNHRVLLKSIPIAMAEVDRQMGTLPGSVVFMEPAEGQPEALKYLISNCESFINDKSACTVDVSGIVQATEAGKPILVDADFVVPNPKPAKAKVQAKPKK